MRFSTKAVVSLVLVSSSSSASSCFPACADAAAAAFVVPAVATTKKTGAASPIKTARALPPSTSSPPLRMSSSSTEDEVAALRAAAAKAREEAERLSREMGKTTAVSADTTASSEEKKKSFEEVMKMLPSIVNESDGSKQMERWESLKDSRSLSQFGTANLRTFPVSLQMLESPTGLTASTLGLDGSGGSVNLDDFKYATVAVTLGSAVLGVLSLALLPPNIGATACYFFAVIPVLFLGVGSSAPQIIANAIAAVKDRAAGDGDDSRPTQRDRVCRHEAAHFCCGYWCGLPVSSYSTGEDGVPAVEFEARGGGSSGQYTETEVAALAVTAMSGLVGESSRYGNADGGANDLLQLEQVFRRSEKFIGAASQQDITRWATLTAGRRNLPKRRGEARAVGRRSVLLPRSRFAPATNRHMRSILPLLFFIFIHSRCHHRDLEHQYQQRGDDNARPFVNVHRHRYIVD